MIIGLGTDLVHSKRVEEVYKKYNTRFLQKIFTDEEISSFSHDEKRFLNLISKGWVAKEAGFKALGTGMRAGLSWHDLILTRNSMGRPFLTFFNKAEQHIKKIIPDNMTYHTHISLTDELPYVSAVVIIETIPC